MNAPITLTKGVGLSTSEAPTILAQATHLTLAGVNMLSVVHLDIRLRRTALAVLFEETAVPSLKDVDLGVGEAGVVLCVNGAVLCTDMTGHDGSPMS